ncbi:hypothetical protein [Spiroplasma poulsonii]|nr:hypothetical protein [Spiroplasma poulsonii]
MPLKEKSEPKKKKKKTLPCQDMLIKWLCSQTDIENYQTERELKMKNGNLNTYPDLIITKNDDSEIYVEFERTRKSPERFRTKLINLCEWLVVGGKIHWITPIQTLAIWIENQINNILVLIHHSIPTKFETTKNNNKEIINEYLLK